MVQFSRPPPVYQRPKFFHSLDLGCRISNEPPPLLSKCNQSINRKHNPGMTIICYQVLSSGRLSFSVSTPHIISPSSWLYTLVCTVVQKYHKMYFIYNYSHFWCSCCNQPVSFSQLENVSNLWKNNHTVHVNKRKTKTQPSHVTFMTKRSIVRFCSQTM